MPKRIQLRRTEHAYALRFGAASVLALLAGRKTQTRRIIRNWPSQWSMPPARMHEGVLCRYGVDHDEILIPPHPREGERFYISEVVSFQPGFWFGKKQAGPVLRYAADEQTSPVVVPSRVKHPKLGRWPGRTLPLEWARPWRGIVTRMSAEQIRDISDSDAKAEGFGSLDHFREIWLQLYAERGIRWMDNPMVWVRGFEAANSTEPSNV